MASDQDNTRVFPIGHYVGAYLDDEQGQQGHHEVRLGVNVVEVDNDTFRLWALAHGIPDQLSEDATWGRQQIIDAATTAGITNAEASIENGINQGLLVEVAPGPDAAVEFATRYRLVPLMLGLGNSAEEPGLYGIGLFGQPFLHVNSMVYSLWEWAHLDRNLWEACETFAQVEAQAGAQEPDETDPHKILENFLVAIHGLLSVNAAYLDESLGPQ